MKTILLLTKYMLPQKCSYFSDIGTDFSPNTTSNFPLSVRFHQFSMLIHLYITDAT